MKNTTSVGRSRHPVRRGRVLFEPTGPSPRMSPEPLAKLIRGKAFLGGSRCDDDRNVPLAKAQVWNHFGGSAEHHAELGGLLHGYATSFSDQPRAWHLGRLLPNLATRHLARVALGTDEAFRRELADFLERDAEFLARDATIPRRFAQACHLARIVRALSSAGFSAVAMAADETVHLGFDLLVPFAAPANGVLMRIRTEPGSRPMSAEHMFGSQDAHARPARRTRGTAIRNARRFSERTGVVYRPVLVMTAEQDDARFRPDDPDAAAYLADFLRAVDDCPEFF